jgi:Peptidase family M13
MFTGTIMAENSKGILRHILEQSSSASLSSRADQDNFKKIKNDYDSCMDEETLRRIGIKPLQDVVNQIKSSFPANVDRVGQSPFPKLEPDTQKNAVFNKANQLTNTLLFLIRLDITALMALSVQVSAIRCSSRLQFIRS